MACSVTKIAPSAPTASPIGLAEAGQHVADVPGGEVDPHDASAGTVGDECRGPVVAAHHLVEGAEPRSDHLRVRPARPIEVLAQQRPGAFGDQCVVTDDADRLGLAVPVPPGGSAPHVRP